jgi:hypothetical protein
MLTYTGRRNLYGTLTNDSSSTNLTLGDTMMNDVDRSIIGLRNWPFLEKAYVQSTVANQQYYNIPNDVDYVLAVTVLISNIQYTPQRAPSIDFWNQLNVSNTITSNQPGWWYLRDRKVGLYPTPSSSTADALTIVGRRRSKDLSKADYTTGTIVSVAVGGTAVVGSGTTWTAGMAGSYLRITDSDTANKGDGNWYEILSVDSATTLTLAKPYQGTAIAAGAAAYTIGQSSPVPEDYQILSVYKAVEYYFTTIQPMPGQADRYRLMYEERLADMISTHGRKSDNPVILDTKNVPFINSNLTISY